MLSHMGWPGTQPAAESWYGCSKCWGILAGNVGVSIPAGPRMGGVMQSMLQWTVPVPLRNEYPADLGPTKTLWLSDTITVVTPRPASPYSSLVSVINTMTNGDRGGKVLSSY